MQLLTLLPLLCIPTVWASPHHRRQTSNFTVGQTVTTTSGSVTGHAASAYSEVSEYLGIPFGQPPVGNLRFAAPVRYSGSGAINASTFGNTCATLRSSSSSPPTAQQLAFSNITAVGLEFLGATTAADVVYSEDCLYLNIWTKPQSGEAKKAVMVYLYGGGFSSGSSSVSVYNGAALVEKEDVIIVNFNYRVSILGFPGNPSSQGNLGFLDQRLALEWIRDNIASFGGDPTRITLFGQSAGGASTDYYSYAFSSDPIVHALIEQSGTAFSFGLPYPAATIAQNWYTVTSAVGCGNASSDATAQLSCMRNVSTDAIFAAVPTSGVNALLSPFGPTVDGTLVFANYSAIPAPALPLLVGSNDYEAGLFRTELALGGVAFADSDWEEMNLSSYTCPIGQRANASYIASSTSTSYRWHGVFPNVNISSEAGAFHGIELQLLFGTTFSSPADTPAELAVEKYIQGAWTTFAKDPVNGLQNYEGGWPVYDPAEKTLIRLAYGNELGDGTNLEYPEVYDAACAEASLGDLLCRIFGECSL
ncbi:hypothetical protein CJF30_00001287 [Rutstroemia sp. NJR-2017a BBW]|nr:hypothetical protein CJF30_00001287 [Rutstroemia sp. NJR-2017a BBW]